MNGKVFYYNNRYWKVVNYDDTSGLYICQAVNDTTYQYFGEDIINGGESNA